MQKKVLGNTEYRSKNSSQFSGGKILSFDANVSMQLIFNLTKCVPLLNKIITQAFSWQARNRLQLQELLIFPVKNPLFIAALIALGATVNLKTGNVSKEIPLEMLGRYKTKGRVSLLNLKIRGIKCSEAHIARTTFDEPIVSVVTVLEINDNIVFGARIALTGVWPEPVRLAKTPVQFTGNPLNESIIKSIAKAVEEEVKPVGDFLGSVSYRRVMAGVLTRRTLKECLNQNERIIE